jgi:hypothetical protein
MNGFATQSSPREDEGEGLNGLNGLNRKELHEPFSTEYLDRIFARSYGR